MPDPRVTLTLPQPILDQVDARAELRGQYQRTAVVSAALARYLYLLDRGRAELAELLEAPELALILQACRSTAFEPWSVAHLPEVVAVARLPTDLEVVGGQALATRLRGLPLGTLLALVDAVETWWARVGAGERDLPPEAALLAPVRRAPPG